MSDAPIPDVITEAQRAAAMDAFMEVLGLNSRAAYFPLIVTQDAIYFPAVVSDDYSETVPKATPLVNHPQGIEHAEMNANVVIKVVDA